MSGDVVFPSSEAILERGNERGGSRAFLSSFVLVSSFAGLRVGLTGCAVDDFYFRYRVERARLFVVRVPMPSPDVTDPDAYISRESTAARPTSSRDRDSVSGVTL